MRDVIIIGGGHNGLVAAAFLAKAGRKPLVLERADRVGGCAVTSEIAPGFRCPILAHRGGLDSAVVDRLGLERHGLHIIRPAARACAPTADGRALTVWADTAATVHDIAAFSPSDATRFPEFLASMKAVGRVVHDITTAPPPDIDKLTPRDLLGVVKAGRRFRALSKADAYRLLRWLPMSVADLASEWFESEPLQALVAADGVLGAFLGPRSAGSAAVSLLLSARDGHPIAPGWTARGAIGAIADALAAAARSAGAEIRTGAEVQHILVEGGTATGVALSTGEEISARDVVSNVDPRRTLMTLVDPIHLGPEFLRRVQNIRMRGTLSKVNYAVAALPDFPSLRALVPEQRAAALSGCIRLARDTDAIERAFDAAKYGRYAEEPWIEMTIPSLGDPGLAPAGQHVVSVYVQFTPYQLRGTTWDAARDRLGEVVTRVIEQYAPGFSQSIVARQVITPLDLERTWGLTGGHIFHGELALDQLVVARPLLGWARYRTPIRNLYLCGAGTHPGTGIDGRSGALAARAVLAATRK